MERVAAVNARNVVAVALSQLPRVEDRLLGVLLVLAEERGRVAADGVRLPSFLTHERLGELIGAARPTVSLAFAKLRERDLVAARDGEWVIALQAGEALVRPPDARAGAA
jgi:CRP-like cAMP-binding protein